MLDPDQLAAAQTLQQEYAQQVASADAESQAYLRSLQASAAAPASSALELRQPHQAASEIARMGRISNAHAMQQEGYLNLIRGFVLNILTPFQAGLLCAAAYPYLIEFPSVISHMVAEAAWQPTPASLPLAPLLLSQAS